MNDPNERGESHYILMAKQLDNIEFPDVIKIVDMVNDGRYTILPYLTHVKSVLPTINPHNLCRCCRVEQLYLPNCLDLSNKTLVNLPYITKLTISSNSCVTGDVFYHLNNLTELQIIYHTTPETIINHDTVKYLKGLECLYTTNNVLVNDDLRFVRNLRILVIDSINPGLTPAILNFLSKMEICIINGVLYKYVESARNNRIIKKIGKLSKIQIYSISNHK